MASLQFSRPSAADRMRGHTLYAIRSTMLDIGGNTPLLLSIVAGGPQQWRNTFLHECRGLAVDDHVADMVFRFFCERVREMYGGAPAGLVLDSLEVSSPPTQREIDDAWEVDSQSSEDGRRYFYGPDGHPEELIKRMRDQ
jgi:hypothetical protein